MKARIKRFVCAIAALAAAAALAVGFSGSSTAAGPTPRLQAFGITADGMLMSAFKTDFPQQLDWVRAVQGLVVDTKLIGIDFRVQNNTMYAVGNHGGIYTVSLVQDREGILTKVSQLTVALHGMNFGVDFNPAADRLRVVSDTGQNLRHNLNDNTTAVDGPLSATGVSAAAYTNNDLNPDTVTTLFDVNPVADQVVVQSPANTGQLAPTGFLRLLPFPNSGCDIYSDLSGGKTISNMMFCAFIAPSSGQASLYTVDMLTGTPTIVGNFPLQVADLTIALDSN